MSHKLRIALEQLIAGKVVDCLLEAKFSVTVYDGEEFTLKKSTSRHEILKALFTTDDDSIYAVDENDKTVGWVRFIYGNSGDDVIHDYTTGLEEVIKPALDFVNMLDEGGYVVDIFPSKAAWNGR